MMAAFGGFIWRGPKRELLMAALDLLCRSSEKSMAALTVEPLPVLTIGMVSTYRAPGIGVGG